MKGSAKHDAHFTVPESSDPGAGAAPEAATRVTAEPSAPPEVAAQPPADLEPEGAAEPAAPEAAPDEPVAEREDPEQQAEREFEALSAKAEKADEYLALAQRTKADFENYRRRAMREAAAAQERGIVKLARELLPAVDNLDRALDVADAASANGPEPGSENGASPLVSGIKLVHADVIAALSRMGIEPFSPLGEPFDPQHHEAVAQQPVEGAEPGTIVEVYQRGFRMGENILRPARVVVAA